MFPFLFYKHQWNTKPFQNKVKSWAEGVAEGVVYCFYKKTLSKTMSLLAQ